MGRGSDEDDGFFRYGTPLEPLSDDEDDDGNGDVYAKTPKPKKQKRIEKEEASGRQGEWRVDSKGANGLLAKMRLK